MCCLCWMHEYICVAKWQLEIRSLTNRCWWPEVYMDECVLCVPYCVPSCSQPNLGCLMPFKKVSEFATHEAQIAACSLVIKNQNRTNKHDPRMPGIRQRCHQTKIRVSSKKVNRLPPHNDGWIRRIDTCDIKHTRKCRYGVGAYIYIYVIWWDVLLCHITCILGGRDCNSENVYHNITGAYITKHQLIWHIFIVCSTIIRLGIDCRPHNIYRTLYCAHGSTTPLLGPRFKVVVI